MPTSPSSSPPPSSSMTPSAPKPSGARLVAVAKTQRLLLCCILGQIGAQLMRQVPVASGLMVIALVAVHGASIWCAASLARHLFGATATGLVAGIMGTGLALALVRPELMGGVWLVDLIVLLIVNRTATRTLKAIGVRVGLLGADPDAVAVKVARR